MEYTAAVIRVEDDSVFDGGSEEVALALRALLEKGGWTIKNVSTVPSDFDRIKGELVRCSYDLGCALVLINFATIAMATLAVVFATRLDIVANLCVCTVVFFLGLVSSYLFQRETGSDALNLLFGFLYAVIPNWQYFWLADAIAVNRPIPLSYVVGCAVYVVIYVCIAAMWAVAVFQNKEVAGDNRV